MSEANKRARIEYLQSLVVGYGKALEHIAAYCETEPQTSAEAIIAKLAREALAISSQDRESRARPAECPLCPGFSTPCGNSNCPQLRPSQQDQTP